MCSALSGDLRLTSAECMMGTHELWLKEWETGGMQDGVQSLGMSTEP